MEGLIFGILRYVNSLIITNSITQNDWLLFFLLYEGQHSLLQWTETFLHVVFYFFRGVPSHTKILHLSVDYDGDSQVKW